MEGSARQNAANISENLDIRRLVFIFGPDADFRGQALALGLLVLLVLRHALPLRRRLLLAALLLLNFLARGGLGGFLRLRCGWLV